MHKAGRWQTWQINAVIQMYPSCSLEDIAKHVGRSPQAISHFASRNNIRKDKEAEFLHRSAARKGEGTPNYKGYRRKTPKGYFVRYAPWHPNASSQGLVMEHRMVMEGLIGRFLAADEVVHHIDGNKGNNSPENLMLMTTGEHSAFHNSRRMKK